MLLGAHTSQALALPVRLSQNNSPPFAPKLPLTPAIQRRCRGSGIQVVCTGECVVSLVCRSFAANCRCCCWLGPERYIQSTPDDCVPYCVLVDKLAGGRKCSTSSRLAPGAGSRTRDRATKRVEMRVGGNVTGQCAAGDMGVFLPCEPAAEKKGGSYSSDPSSRTVNTARNQRGARVPVVQ